MNAVTIVHILSPSGGRSVQALPNSFFKIHFNIILSSTPRYSKWSFHVSPPSETLCVPLLSPTCATCIPLVIIFDFIIVVNVGELNSFTDPQCKVKGCKTPVDMANSCTENTEKFLLKTRKNFFFVKSTELLFTKTRKYKKCVR